MCTILKSVITSDFSGWRNGEDDLLYLSAQDTLVLYKSTVIIVKNPLQRIDNAVETKDNQNWFTGMQNISALEICYIKKFSSPKWSKKCRLFAKEI